MRISVYRGSAYFGMMSKGRSEYDDGAVCVEVVVTVDDMACMEDEGTFVVVVWAGTLFLRDDIRWV